MLETEGICAQLPPACSAAHRPLLPPARRLRCPLPRLPGESGAGPCGATMAGWFCMLSMGKERQFVPLARIHTLPTMWPLSLHPYHFGQQGLREEGCMTHRFESPDLALHLVTYMRRARSRPVSPARTLPFPQRQLLPAQVSDCVFVCLFKQLDHAKSRRRSGRWNAASTTTTQKTLLQPDAISLLPHNQLLQGSSR